METTADFAISRRRKSGGTFTQKPLEMGPVITAVLDDTCGNLIQLAQHV